MRRLSHYWNHSLSGDETERMEKERQELHLLTPCVVLTRHDSGMESKGLSSPYDDETAILPWLGTTSALAQRRWLLHPLTSKKPESAHADSLPDRNECVCRGIVQTQFDQLSDCLLSWNFQDLRVSGDNILFKCFGSVSNSKFQKFIFELSLESHFQLLPCLLKLYQLMRSLCQLRNSHVQFFT